MRVREVTDETERGRLWKLAVAGCGVSAVRGLPGKGTAADPTIRRGADTVDPMCGGQPNQKHGHAAPCDSAPALGEGGMPGTGPGARGRASAGRPGANGLAVGDDQLHAGTHLLRVGRQVHAVRRHVRDVVDLDLPSSCPSPGTPPAGRTAGRRPRADRRSGTAHRSRARAPASRCRRAAPFPRVRARPAPRCADDRAVGEVGREQLQVLGRIRPGVLVAVVAVEEVRGARRRAEVDQPWTPARSPRLVATDPDGRGVQGFARCCVVGGGSPQPRRSRGGAHRTGRLGVSGPGCARPWDSRARASAAGARRSQRSPTRPCCRSWHRCSASSPGPRGRS